MAKNTRLYFVYGDSMNLGRLNKWLFQRGGRPDGIQSTQRAVLKGYKLVFNVRQEIPWKAGVANLEESAKGEVEGLLLEVDATIDNLLQKKEGHPARTRRIEVAVTGDQDKEYDRVFTFVSTQADEGKTHPPSKAYVDLLLETARDFDFSASYKGKLEKLKTAD